jgi:hypothetical protein
MPREVGLRGSGEEEPDMIRTFLLGAVAGGVAVLVWGDRARAYVDARLAPWRRRLLGALDAVSDTLDGLRDRIETGLPARHSGSPGELGALAGAERAERRGAAIRGAE